MVNYDIYDGSQLQQAFKAAHAGIKAMAYEHPEQFTQAHLESAQAFIKSHPLFADFSSTTPVAAELIKSRIETYFNKDTRPDVEMDVMTMTLIHRWVSGFKDELRQYDNPAEGCHPKYGFPLSPNTLSIPAAR